MITGIGSALFWFIIFMGAHIFAFHLKPGQDRSKTILRLFALAIIGHLVSIFLVSCYLPTVMEVLSSGVALSIFAGSLLMACLFVLYMPFYYTVDTSLSVETLAMLTTKGDGFLPLGQVVTRFTSEEFLLDRLETMSRNGYLLREVDGAYSILPRGRQAARFMMKVKDFLALGPGG